MYYHDILSVYNHFKFDMSISALFTYFTQTFLSDKIIIRSFLCIAITWVSAKWVREYFDSMFLMDSYLIKQSSIKPPSMSPDNQFKHNALHKFLETYNPDFAAINNINSNIDDVFYLKGTYKEAIKEQNNGLERIWKQRIIMIATPSCGNVIMCFDPYKGGFSYYSDQSMPYPLLNAVAMKYVIMYRCRDFFLDEQVIPADHPSPLLKILTEEDDAKPDPKNAITNTDLSNNVVDISNNPVSTIPNVKKGPFAKLKNYAMTPLSNQNAASTYIPILIEGKGHKGLHCSVNQPVNYIEGRDHKGLRSQPVGSLIVKNKFIYLGKISNFCILSRSPPKEKIDLFSDKKGSTTNKTAALSYRDFMFWRSPEPAIL